MSSIRRSYNRRLSPATPPQPTIYDPAIIKGSSEELPVGIYGLSSSSENLPEEKFYAGASRIAHLPYSLKNRPSSPLKQKKINMDMAVTGSLAAQPGVETPLAVYAAQMVVWLWYGNHSSHAPISPPNSYSTEQAMDPFDESHQPSPALHPHQVQPSPHFAQFVARLLQTTNVSHSVTLIALLYIYRFKLRNLNIMGSVGSEQRVFVAGLMLGNKYLDDNTYTNRTWADLTSMPLKDINNMEKEFLRGLEFQLVVKQREYQHWRKLLDGFMLSREREAYIRQRQPFAPVFGNSPPVIYTPTIPVQPSMAAPMYRTRSASPPYLSTSAPKAYVFPSPDPTSLGKRTAVDAFSNDMPYATTIQEQMRLPSRKAAFASNISYEVPATRPPSGLGRSSSLSRQIARMPGQHVASRRGSAGQLRGAELDLRHAATNHAAHIQRQSMEADREWEGFDALAAPFEMTQMVQPAPEHLMFYQLAAEPHPGQDGAPRKAILHYQDVFQPNYQPIQYSDPYISQYNPDARLSIDISPNDYSPVEYLSSDQQYGIPSPVVYVAPGHVEPQYIGGPAWSRTDIQPAPFVNAGPPGYIYNPHHRQTFYNFSNTSQTQFAPDENMSTSGEWLNNVNRLSIASDEYQPNNEINMGLGGGNGLPPQGWRPRSEWSSPMPGMRAYDQTQTWER